MIVLFVAALFIVVATYTILLQEFKRDNNMQNSIIELLKHTNEIGIKNNFSFSSQEVLDGCAMGLDGKNRKLLVVRKLDPISYDWNLIDLDHIINCTLKKTFKSINAGELSKRRIEEYLEAIYLKLELINVKEPVEIPFYTNDAKKESDVKELDRKARNWQILLSKMRRQLKKIA